VRLTIVRIFWQVWRQRAADVLTYALTLNSGLLRRNKSSVIETAADDLPVSSVPPSLTDAVEKVPNCPAPICLL
jgi:hypothetical protein